MYLSPFKDVWGSRIIFAGPHKVFTKINQEQLRASNLAVYSAGSDKVQQNSNNNLKTRKDRFNPIDRIRTSFYSTLEASDDIKEVRDHFCSVHKAVIPIARIRVLLDQDDIGDTLSFRCPDCAKCLNCRKSQRSNAVSLQEAREQVIIELSVKICTDTCTVIAKYPFLKDPVDFLSARHNGPNNKDQALKIYKGQCRKSKVKKTP